MTDATPNVIRPPEQLWIAGTKPPDIPDDPVVKEKIYLWLDKKVQQKRAGVETREAHADMISTMIERGFDWHPYLDPYSQKKRRVWIAKEPKAKTTSVPKPPGEGKKKRGRKARFGGPSRDDDAVIEPGEDLVDAPETDDDKVESRRVPRKAVEAEIDPFGSLRERMGAGSILDDAEAVQRGEPVPPPHANGVNPALTGKRTKRKKAKRGK